MNFRNEKHRLAFDEAIRKLNKKNFALMSALYLLTAEHKLWMQIRNFVERNEIKFDRFKPKDSTENGYILKTKRSMNNTFGMFSMLRSATPMVLQD